MRGRRWDRAAAENTAYPTPNLIRPNAYDIKLILDHPKQICYMGPIVRQQPPAQVPYDNVTVLWDNAAPDFVVTGVDDFSVDHTNDLAWWSDASNFAHVAGGQQDFSAADGMAIFKKAPKATEQTVVAKFKLVATDIPGVRGVVPALSVQDGWASLFSLGMFWQGDAFWIQGTVASGTQQNLVSDVFRLQLDTDYWLRATSKLSGPDSGEFSCGIFLTDPSLSQGALPLFQYSAPLIDVPKLAVPAFTGLHLVGPGVLLDQYRVESLGEDTGSVLKNFDFRSRIQHQYSGPRKWRTITIQWLMGVGLLTTTTYRVFI